MLESYFMAPTSDVQPENIDLDDVTAEVVKLSDTYMVVSLEQLQNIISMKFTFAVLKPLKSSVERDEQLRNIYRISVTFSVFRFSMPLMVVREEQELNQP